MVDIDGLEAWMVSGLRATADDRGRRRAYFALDDPLAQRLLARGGAASDFRRAESRLAAQLTALWGLRPPLRPALAPADAPAPRRTSFTGTLLRFPERFPGLSGDAAMALYRAAAAHLGAHLTYTPQRLAIGTLKPLQVTLVSLIEDARVEALALRAMPGLRHFWSPFHVALPHGGTAPALLARLARALLDPAYRDDDAWVAKGRTLFAQATLTDPRISRPLGGLLGNDLGQMRVQFNPHTYVVEPAYRDDNAGLWDFPDAPDAVMDDIALTIDTARIERCDEPQAPASDDAPPRDDVGRARPAAPAAAEGDRDLPRVGSRAGTRALRLDDDRGDGAFASTGGVVPVDALGKRRCHPPRPGPGEDGDDRPAPAAEAAQRGRDPRYRCLHRRPCRPADVPAAGSQGLCAPCPRPARPGPAAAGPVGIDQ
ncbi:hypothetical protein [Vineibacter terrae]|uniref:hypothetical protein n=1 Tax=Vineibacter terrae TaxID=2586908 RepID=UPI0015B753ED|nr:hypothetical protein [Vineibacter terrae]